MSRQRPYGTFEEAYILMLSIYNKNLFEAFLYDCKRFADLGSKNKIEKMRLPATYILGINGRSYIPFWQCLSRMYGEMFGNPSDSYVYTENLDMMIYNIEHIYEQVKDEKFLVHDPDSMY